MGYLHRHRSCCSYDIAVDRSETKEITCTDICIRSECLRIAGVAPLFQVLLDCFTATYTVDANVYCEGKLALYGQQVTGAEDNGRAARLLGFAAVREDQWKCGCLWWRGTGGIEAIPTDRNKGNAAAQTEVRQQARGNSLGTSLAPHICRPERRRA